MSFRRQIGEDVAVKQKSIFSIALVGTTAIAILLGSACAFAVGEESEFVTDQGAQKPMEPLEYPGGLSEEEYLALPTDNQLSLKLSEEDAPSDDAKLQEQLAPTKTEFGRASAQFSDPIQAIGATYPKVFSRFEVEMENEKVVIGYDQSSDESDRELLFAEIGLIMDPFPYEVVFSPKSYNRLDVQTVSDELATDFELWAPRFGNAGYSAAPDVEGDGVVRVFTEGEPDPMWTHFEHKGVPVVVESVGAPVVTFQSRTADFSPGLI